jgi:hypothetical protein
MGFLDVFDGVIESGQDFRPDVLPEAVGYFISEGNIEALMVAPAEGLIDNH